MYFTLIFLRKIIVVDRGLYHKILSSQKIKMFFLLQIMSFLSDVCSTLISWLEFSLYTYRIFQKKLLWHYPKFYNENRFLFASFYRLICSEPVRKKSCCTRKWFQNVTLESTMTFPASLVKERERRRPRNVFFTRQWVSVCRKTSFIKGHT